MIYILYLPLYIRSPATGLAFSFCSPCFMLVRHHTKTTKPVKSISECDVLPRTTCAVTLTDTIPALLATVSLLSERHDYMSFYVAGCVRGWERTICRTWTTNNRNAKPRAQLIPKRSNVEGKRKTLDRHCQVITSSKHVCFIHAPETRIQMVLCVPWWISVVPYICARAWLETPFTAACQPVPDRL